MTNGSGGDNGKTLAALKAVGVAYLALLLVVLGLLCAYPKVELHLMLNAYHSDVADVFFKYYSVLAEWPLYVLALLPLLWKRKELTIFYAVCELSAGAVVQILKYMFSAPRPISVFEHYPDALLPLVEGVHLHHSNSFPSGHTSTFFVFATCCAIVLACHYRQRGETGDRRTWLLLDLQLTALLALAALGGYSRIYLSQHFLSDVCVGSIIGVLVPCMVYYFAGQKFFEALGSAALLCKERGRRNLSETEV